MKECVIISEAAILWHGTRFTARHGTARHGTAQTESIDFAQMYFGAECNSINIQMLVIFKQIDKERWGLYHWSEFSSSFGWILRRSENSRSHFFKFYQADYDRTLLWALLGGFIDLPAHSFGCRNFIWTWEVKMSDFQHFCKIEQISIFGWGYLWKQTLLRGLSPLI